MGFSKKFYLNNRGTFIGGKIKVEIMITIYIIKPHPLVWLRIYRFICYANEGSLAGLLAAVALNLSWSVRINLALDIACSLHHLHSHSLIHRDLTSQNILIRVHTRSHPDTTDNYSDSTFNFDYQTVCNGTLRDRLTQSKLSGSESDAFVQGSTHTNGLSHKSCHSHNLCRRHSSRVNRQQSNQFSRIPSNDETNEFLPVSSNSNEEYPTDIDNWFEFSSSTFICKPTY
ncbi:unnamed protein product [Schistosoma intercalatum]|nr:unnamed protein product [Schistosoma intercalatum]